ncbi:alpha/beta fold hydrolase [Frankia sp. R82]|uniref:alpha/beta fold hydrolase n=1 Tax=Frankia sp. R82 TaxID=2950553 RepID=UPI002042E536|nr:alpha/beta hydrolase [Frankia sp. R82]MCM3884095.1 alpha/beta hydrolase [Frankia sp. R82]
MTPDAAMGDIARRDQAGPVGRPGPVHGVALPSLVLVHGTATTGAIWRRVRRELAGRQVSAPDRPSSGSLPAELAALRPLTDGAVYGGVSGGATLGLALLAAGAPLVGAVLHEPAVGSLLPGLLGPVAAAYAAGGVPALARTLYGPAWTPTDAPSDPGAVERDLAMFLEFEPAPLPDRAIPAIITVGADSPPVRHRAAAVLQDRLKLPVRVIPGCGHAAHLEAPAAFARLLADVHRS